jgi:hypothetical protein
MQAEFCTLFDAHYLARALVLYRSLEDTGADFRLRAFCMDAESKELLDRLRLPGLTTIGLDALEAAQPGLPAVKGTRSRTEYYWTATPAVALHALEREPDLEMVTYLDADLMFFSGPGPLFAELADGNVAITPHRYAPEFERDNISGGHSADSGGIFNVQFIAVRRNEVGLEALTWWRDRCLEWCYDRVEEGRYGDQKYLDEWPRRFPGVRVLEHPGGGLAPWNVSRYRIEPEGGGVTVDGWPLIFHHYQSLRLHRATDTARRLARVFGAYRFTDGEVPLVWTTGWRLSKRELDVLWEPYVRRISEAIADLRAVGAGEELGLSPLRAADVAYHMLRRRLPRPVRRAYWSVRRIASTTRSASASVSSG